MTLFQAITLPITFTAYVLGLICGIIIAPFIDGVRDVEKIL